MNKAYITDYLAHHAATKGDQTALVSAGSEMTWHELWQNVKAAAAYISSVTSDDQQQVVALLLPNGRDFVVDYLAIVHAGHIAMPIDVIYKTLEIDAIINQIQPVALVTDQPERTGTGIKLLSPQELLSGKGNHSHLRLSPEEQIASLVFTSGTTGKPKTAPYTHAGHIWNIEVCSEAWGWSEADTMLLNLRLSHWYGLCMGLSGILYHGNTLYLQERFTPEDTLKMLASGKISHYTHTPMAYQSMLEEKGEYDLSQVKLCISGSAPLPPPVWEKFKDRFGIEIIECYGSSETGRIASNLATERVPGSPGRLLRDVQLKFGPHQEVMIKSPGVFPGYFNNPEATKVSLKNGWWDTGDIGELEDDRLILKGRSQERIRKQGYHISPRDIEWALLKNNSIKDAAVVGLPGDNESSDTLVYFVVGPIDKAELRAYVKTALPSVWRPDRVIHLDEIPRTVSGKPRLPKLRAML